MAKVYCKCGELLSNSMAPNDIQLRVYTDKEWDVISEKGVMEFWEFPFPTYDIWRCPECERIYVFGSGGGRAIKVYVLDEQIYCLELDGNGRIHCGCGELLSSSGEANDIQLKVYTDREWDAILENDIVEASKIPLPTHDVWRCSECERIYVLEENKVVKAYQLEE